MIPFIVAGSALGIFLALEHFKTRKIPLYPKRRVEPKIKIVDVENNKVEKLVDAEITPSSNKNLDKLENDVSVNIEPDTSN